VPRWQLLLLCVASFACVCNALAGSPSNIISVVTGRKQLFLDDYAIGAVANLKRTLHHPVRHPGNPIVRGDRPWDSGFLQIRGAPLYVPEEKLWKMYYICSPWPAPKKWEGWLTCLATSGDGLHWEKPALGLVEYKGSRDNNIILDGLLSWVFYEPDEPDPNRRYKAIGWGPNEWPFGYRAAFSPDGINWLWPSQDRAFVGNDECQVAFDESSGRYVAFPKISTKVAGTDRRSFAVTFSNDFLTWDFLDWGKPRRAVVPDETDDLLSRERVAAFAASGHMEHAHEILYDQVHAQFYNFAGFPYGSRYVGILSVYDVIHGTYDGPIYLELLSSSDCIQWNRVCGREIFMSLGAEGSFDCGMLFPSSRPVIRDDEIWLYYSGFNATHDSTLGRRKNGAAVGLATLRLDGWVSLEAQQDWGSVRTKPFELHGSRLFVNLDAPGGELRAEILNPQSHRPVPGFTQADSLPVTGDTLRGPVQWQSNADLSTLEGKAIEVRFLLRRGNLYAFWTED